MTWLTWRQFRVPAISVYTGLAAIAVVLAITGPDLVGRGEFADQDLMFGGTILVLYLLPAIIGVFWGVPMVTRELETGTHNLVWNQSITRKRWLATKLGVGVAATVVAAALLSTAVTWWAAPIDAHVSADPKSFALTRMEPVVFAARGIVPVGYAAFAFVLGVAVGILLRRTVAAMAVTLTVFAAVLVAVPFLVRPYVIPPVEDTVTITDSNIGQIRGNESGVIESITVAQPAGAWVLANETVDASGTAVFPLPDAVQHCLPPFGGNDGPPDRMSVTECVAQLSGLGYSQRVTYQPGSRFWALQWIELGLFLALSGLLTWFCFRRIRHLS
ncbi:transporter [Actinophytocola glycyrrhizae]|uniref:Transporter n=1 Tax=Actinophytocola glycyrrhizae TaxID=2044873 RepID=A0ABV9SB21_9PSEU